MIITKQNFTQEFKSILESGTLANNQFRIHHQPVSYKTTVATTTTATTYRFTFRRCVFLSAVQPEYEAWSG
jgi:hypothetical protein